MWMACNAHDHAINAGGWMYSSAQWTYIHVCTLQGVATYMYVYNVLYTVHVHVHDPCVHVQLQLYVFWIVSTVHVLH